MGALIVLIANPCIAMYEITLANKLKADFSMSDSSISLTMSSAKISLLLALLALGFGAHSIDKRILITPGLFVFTLGVYFLGPSLLLHIPNTVEVVVVGLVLFGMGKSMMQCYVVNELIEAGFESFPDHE